MSEKFRPGSRDTSADTGDVSADTDRETAALERELAELKAAQAHDGRAYNALAGPEVPPETLEDVNGAWLPIDPTDRARTLELRDIMTARQSRIRDIEVALERRGVKTGPRAVKGRGLSDIFSDLIKGSK